MPGVGVAADAGGGCLPESVGAGAWGGGEHGGGESGVGEGAEGVALGSQGSSGSWRDVCPRVWLLGAKSWMGPRGWAAADMSGRVALVVSGYSMQPLRRTPLF